MLTTRLGRTLPSILDACLAIEAQQKPRSAMHKVITRVMFKAMTASKLCQPSEDDAGGMASRQEMQRSWYVPRWLGTSCRRGSEDPANPRHAYDTAERLLAYFYAYTAG